MLKVEASSDILGCQSEVLFMYSNKQDCQRRKVVKDFCFPDDKDCQINLQKLNSSQEVQEVLYGQNDTLRRNSFVFNMQADDMDCKEF